VSLAADLRVPGRGVAVALQVPAGRTLAMVGPNGAGKSTVLAAVAGLLPDAAGSVLIDGRQVGRQPAHRRRTALLDQDALLFGHLSVLDNVAFGPRAAGAGRRQARALAAQWLDRAGAADLADRRPATLSGGQAQRVALARALAADPQVLLLDEPLAALDVGAAGQLRTLLQEVLADRTCLLVTHELLDVLLLADEVAVLVDGSVVEQGPVAEVLGRPRSAFAAELAGLNLLPGVAVAAGTVRTAVGDLDGVADAPLPTGAAVLVTFPPAAVHLAPDTAGAGHRAAVTAVEPRGTHVRVRLGDVAADLPALAARGIAAGAVLRWSVPAAQVQVQVR
jgi:molybdate transport system ATP-binding protein